MHSPASGFLFQPVPDSELSAAATVGVVVLS